MVSAADPGEFNVRYERRSWGHDSGGYEERSSEMYRHVVLWKWTDDSKTCLLHLEYQNISQARNQSETGGKRSIRAEMYVGSMLMIQNMSDAILPSVCTSVKWLLKVKAYGTQWDSNVGTDVAGTASVV
jgi:hypothetical protein